MDPTRVDGKTVRCAALYSRRCLQRRAAMLGILAIAVGMTVALPPRPLLVWNASASAPVGLYAVGAAPDSATGNMVIADLSEPMRSFAARRHYLPVNVPLVKRVAAGPGDTVCANGEDIFINGHPVAKRLTIDGAGRLMPWWSGCLLLRRGALFLLMSDSPASFDGRYFGPTKRSDVVGKATLLWSR